MRYLAEGAGGGGVAAVSGGIDPLPPNAILLLVSSLSTVAGQNKEGK